MGNRPRRVVGRRSALSIVLPSRGSQDSPSRSHYTEIHFGMVFSERRPISSTTTSPAQSNPMLRWSSTRSSLGRATRTCRSPFAVTGLTSSTKGLPRRLGYNTDARLPQTTAAMGISAESFQRQFCSLECRAVQEDGADPLYIYTRHRGVATRINRPVAYWKVSGLNPGGWQPGGPCLVRKPNASAHHS